MLAILHILHVHVAAISLKGWNEVARGSEQSEPPGKRPTISFVFSLPLKYFAGRQKATHTVL